MEIPRFNDLEDIARRFEREQRGVLRKREEELSESLAPYRVGSVPYLNAVPLTRGLESEIVFATPSKLAEMLQRDELDAALTVFLLELHEKRDLLPARRAPRRPEVDDEHFAPPLLDRLGFAFEVGEAGGQERIGVRFRRGGVGPDAPDVHAETGGCRRHR